MRQLRFIVTLVNVMLFSMLARQASGEMSINRWMLRTSITGAPFDRASDEQNKLIERPGAMTVLLANKLDLKAFLSGVETEDSDLVVIADELHIAGMSAFRAGQDEEAAKKREIGHRGHRLVVVARRVYVDQGFAMFFAEGDDISSKIIFIYGEVAYSPERASPSWSQGGPSTSEAKSTAMDAVYKVAEEKYGIKPADVRQILGSEGLRIVKPKPVRRRPLPATRPMVATTRRVEALPRPDLARLRLATQPSASRAVETPDVLNREEVNPIGVALKAGLVFECKSGHIELLKGIERASEFVPPEALSEWKLEMLKILRNGIEEANLAGNSERYLELFEMVRGVSNTPFPSHDDARPVITALTQLKDQLLPVVSRQTISVPTGVGASQRVIRFVERGSLQGQLAPTDALVISQEDGKLGFVRQDPSNPDRVELSFNARLGVDPRLAALASAEILQAGQTIKDGAFANWQLSAPKLSTQGIAGFKAEVVNDIVQVSLTLDAGEGNLALWRLGTSEGLPLSLHYKCDADARIEGDLPLRLTLAKRERPQVDLNKAFVNNLGHTALTLEYYMLGKRPVVLSPELVVGPGKTVRLPIPEGAAAGEESISLPAQGVRYSGRDAFSLDDFDTAHSGGIVQRVEVENLLAARNDDLGLSLHHVEFTIVYAVGEGNTGARRRAGPFKLSPRGSEGSLIVVPFLKPSSGKYSFFIEGTAFYDDGRSHRAFQSKETSDLNIKIEEVLFKQ